MNINLLSFIVLLCFVQLCQTKQNQQSQNTNKMAINIVIVSISLVIIIAQFIVYKKQKYQRSLVPFAVYSQKIQQVTSSNDMPEKSSDIFEQPSSDNISPKNRKSQDGGESSDRRKRRRKADKLSDRRSKEDASLDGEQK